ncbi:hypothetical protein GV791_01615 [Nocardia cyriacigeorgica]|uniref:DUF4760 domain-containing protein n=1 Tax=Nocardia cyriacigeorgica TaxID=135487 RepID=A0A6P1CFB2_9NOCA|nr:hypothetical protein [Nocardia cyriacigeorgica]MBF6082619.1 hypothetical protein [Nocardia cyriacigeorgica]MBF6289379.1 hypothetical protein [Nocardia cyriacigeorgica]MBF6425259.1 hypothetical protein [Nocardia cyriacigeorgica]NEW31259.1 hypothetical protein [Nocardia cyriacigeorgica]BDT89870.1 hypothetical protein FMUAM8_56340 [Nocardia cyriacigeorgica]
MDSSAIAAAAGVATALIALVAASLVVWQVTEMRKTTNASAFKAVYDMLQDERIRQDRRLVMRELRFRELGAWTEEEILRAERVCHSYDCVAIMCRNGYIPTVVVADSWGDSLRTCWSVLRPLVEKYRADRGAPELWDDFAWLAGRATELHGRRQSA